MNLDAFRRLSSRLIFAASAVLSSVIVGSCGGGGAVGEQPITNLALLPAQATLFAGVAYDFQIAGGRKPYLLSSSEPTLLPLPSSVDGNSFQVVAANPFVIDAGLTENDLPVRSVILTVRDSLGTSFSTGQGSIKVARNFLTGYGVVFQSTCTTGQTCSGTDAIVRLVATTNGNLYGNRAVRFCVVRGNFQFVLSEVPSNLPAVLANCVDTQTDHLGVAIARIRIPADAVTQLATLRVTDIATGVNADQVFTIVQGSIVGALTILPNSFTFTGARAGICGTGSADFLVFDGDPPYTAVASNPNISVSPTTNSSNPARFTVIASNAFVCVDTTVVVTDRNNRRGTVTVKTEEGSATLPPLVVSPTTVTLNDTCGFSTSVTAVGGVGPISANSGHPRVSASLSGNTITITRLTPDPVPPAGPAFYPTTATVSVTDGATVQSVTVNGVRQFCP